MKTTSIPTFDVKNNGLRPILSTSIAAAEENEGQEGSSGMAAKSYSLTATNSDQICRPPLIRARVDATVTPTFSRTGSSWLKHDEPPGANGGERGKVEDMAPSKDQTHVHSS